MILSTPKDHYQLTPKIWHLKHVKVPNYKIKKFKPPVKHGQRQKFHRNLVNPSQLPQNHFPVHIVISEFSNDDPDHLHVLRHVDASPAAPQS